MLCDDNTEFLSLFKKLLIMQKLVNNNMLYMLLRSVTYT
jgi:hypothetical protein